VKKKARSNFKRRRADHLTYNGESKKKKREEEKVIAREIVLPASKIWVVRGKGH